MAEYTPTFRFQWSDDMTEEQKYCYMLEVNRHQLINHIISGEQNTFAVMAGIDGHVRTFNTFKDALDSYNQIEGYAYIALYTRIGTQVIIERKG